MTEVAADFAKVEIHPHRIQPYGKSKKSCSEIDSLNVRASYNLYIGSIMNREVCFSPRVGEDDQDLWGHIIGEEMENASETESFNSAEPSPRTLVTED